MTKAVIEEMQKEICKKYDAEFLCSQSDLKVGISTNVREGMFPVNGLRHPPTSDTTGWYIYAGEVSSDDPDFYKPLRTFTCQIHAAFPSARSDWCKTPIMDTRA